MLYIINHSFLFSHCKKLIALGLLLYELFCYLDGLKKHKYLHLRLFKKNGLAQSMMTK